MQNKTVTRKNSRLPKWPAISLCLAVMTMNSCEISDQPVPNPYLQSQTDQQFLANASYVNLDEISAANLAVVKSMNDSVISFGQLMLTDHTSAEDALKLVAQVFNYPIPQQADAQHVQTVNMMQSLPDSAFDTTYIRAQINDHENAVALFQQELANGQDTTVKAYASQYLPMIQMHLTMADSLIVQLERP